MRLVPSLVFLTTLIAGPALATQLHTVTFDELYDELGGTCQSGGSTVYVSYTNPGTCGAADMPICWAG